MTLGELSSRTSIGTRIRGFLGDWIAPLLSVPERQEFLGLFDKLGSECLSDCYAADRWDSDLTSDGIPMEFSCVVDPEGAGSVRFIIDPQPGPQHPTQARPRLQRCAEFAVPPTASSRDLTDRLLDLHLAGVPDFDRSYVGYGARFAPGKPQAGRIYFKTWWMPSGSVYRSLSDLVKNDGLRRFRSSSIGRERIQGVGYDFHPRGLARVKIYVWTDIPPRDVVAALGTELPGLHVAPLDELIALVNETRRDPTPRSPVLIGVGFAPSGDYCDLKVCLPAPAWGWRTFHALESVLSAVLGHWGLSTDFAPTGEQRGTPWWYFVPTWVSIDLSPRGENLSIYFKPVKKPTEGAASPSSEYTRRADFPPSERSTAFGMMFSQLLQAEAAIETVPRVHQG